jgi:E-phenylitaconyl-CoA hydratase
MPAVLYETHDCITLNRPDALNAFNRDMHAELREAWLAFREHDDLWVAIVTAAGDRAFSAGADVKEMGQRREDA